MNIGYSISSLFIMLSRFHKCTCPTRTLALPPWPSCFMNIYAWNHKPHAVDSPVYSVLYDFPLTFGVMFECLHCPSHQHLLMLLLFPGSERWHRPWECFFFFFLSWRTLSIAAPACCCPSLVFRFPSHTHVSIKKSCLMWKSLLQFWRHS